MLNKKKIILFLVLCLSIIIIASRKIINAEDNLLLTKEIYFQNLRNNFGHNYYGTCGYVAIEMMLLYYDTFLNDDIVDDVFEVNTSDINNSPGSYNDSNDFNGSSMSYYDYIESKKSISLHAFLVEIGINHFGYGYSIDSNQQINIIEYYLETIVGFEKNIDFVIESISSQNNSNTKTWIIDKILSNNIVLTSIADYQFQHNGTIIDGGSHSLIAYEYTNNDIFMNYGYHSGNVNTYRAGMEIIDSHGDTIEYNTYTSGITVSFYNNHAHCNNYCFSKNYKYHENYCPCGYKHQINHDYIIMGDVGICRQCQHEDELDFSPILLTDPDQNTLHGTFVSLYGGDFRGTDLCVGFTRILYFDYNSPSVSRLDYDWECSNPNVATITSYGTIIGLAPGIVTIKAVLKSDPRKIGMITICVSNDLSFKTYYLSMTTDNRSNINENGTEVSVLNNPRGLTTIHSGYSRVLGFTQQNVYPSLRDFIWHSSNSSVAIVSEFGTVFALDVFEETEVTITGFYRINNNIQVNITFTIIPYEGD